MKNINYSLNPSWRNTRNGFAHDCKFFIEIAGIFYNFSATCFYFNRTWECYQFQTVKKCVVNKAINFFTEDLKNKSREISGKNFRSNKTKDIFKNLCSQSQEIKVLNKIYNSL